MEQSHESIWSRPEFETALADWKERQPRKQPAATGREAPRAFVWLGRVAWSGLGAIGAALAALFMQGWGLKQADTAASLSAALAEPQRIGTQAGEMTAVLERITELAGSEGRSTPSATSSATIGRVIALSKALGPYQQVDPRTNALSGTLGSPERGQLLLALTRAELPDWFMRAVLQNSQPCFDHASLRGADLQRAKLGTIRLNHADLGMALLTHCSLRFAMMSHSNMVGTKFCFSDLTGAAMDNCDLREAQFAGAVINMAVFSGSDLTDASFDHAYTCWPYLLDDLAAQSAAGFVRSEWEQVKLPAYPPENLAPPIIDRGTMDWWEVRRVGYHD